MLLESNTFPEGTAATAAVDGALQEHNQLVDRADAYPISRPNDDRSEKPTFLDSLPDLINTFRIPGYDATTATCWQRRFYKDMSSAERLAIPSVESQIVHVEKALCQWMGGAVSRAATDGYRGYEDDYYRDVGQVQGITALADAFDPLRVMWLQDYYREAGEREDPDLFVPPFEEPLPEELKEGPPINRSGKFVEWYANRHTRQVARKLGAQSITKHQQEAAQQATTVPYDISHTSKHPKVRRTAYDTRMNAKIGLACMRVVNPTCRQELTRYFGDISDAFTDLLRPKEMHDRREELTVSKAAVNRLNLRWNFTPQPSDLATLSTPTSETVPF